MTTGKTVTRGFLALVTVLAAVSVMGCASVKPTAVNTGLKPTATEGVVTIVRITAGGKGARIEPKELNVSLDGKVVTTVAKNQRLKIQVPNGSHTLSVQEAKGKSYVADPLTFVSDGKEVLFHVYVDNAGGGGLKGGLPKLVLLKMN